LKINIREKRYFRPRKNKSYWNPFNFHDGSRGFGSLKNHTSISRCFSAL